MKAANKRLAQLTDQFTPKFKVITSICDWDCGEDDCVLCGIEAELSYQFYKEHSPASTGCTWEEYFYKQQCHGFQPEELTYKQYREELTQW